MKRFWLLPVIAGLLLAACEQRAPVDQPADEPAEPVEFLSFGEEISEDGPALAAADLDAQPTTYAGQAVRIEGTVVEVCRQAGCWLSFDNPAGAPVRVHVPRDDDGAYLWTLPMDLGPRRAIVEGVARADTLSVDELRHYAEDAGRAQAEIDAITEPELTASVVARGILVEQPAAPLPPPAGDPADSPAGAPETADSPAGA